MTDKIEQIGLQKIDHGEERESKANLSERAVSGAAMAAATPKD